MGNRLRASLLVLPLLAGVVDMVGTIDVIDTGGRCATDCTAGVVLFPFAPTLTPLAIVGIGDDDRTIATGAVVAAYVVVLALLVAWWWFLGGVFARYSREGERFARVPSVFRYFILYIAAVVLTALVKLPILALEARAGLWASIPLELVIWAAVFRLLTSSKGWSLQRS